MVLGQSDFDPRFRQAPIVAGQPPGAIPGQAVPRSLGQGGLTTKQAPRPPSSTEADDVKRQQQEFQQMARDAGEAFQSLVIQRNNQIRGGGASPQFFAILEKEFIEAARVWKDALKFAGKDTSVVDKSLASALDGTPKVPITRISQKPGQQDVFVGPGGQQVAPAIQNPQQFRPNAPTVVGPGQQAVTSEGPIPGSAVPATQVDIQGPLTGAANLSLKMLNDGLPPEQIRSVLEVMATGSGDERLTTGLDAIAQALPESQEAFQVERSQQEVEAAQPKINELVSAGLLRDVATALVIGGRGATVNLQTSPTAFGQGEMAAIRGDIRTARGVSRAIESVIPLINEGTIGLFPAFSETVGGVAQNLPVIRDILNAVGKPLGLDIKSVKTAQEGRAAFRQVIGVFSRFISQKGGRLSNEDRQFAREAVRLLETSSLPETVIGAMRTLTSLVQKIESAAQGELETGGVSPLQGRPSTNITVRPREGGGFNVIDEQGNTQTLTVQ